MFSCKNGDAVLVILKIQEDVLNNEATKSFVLRACQFLRKLAHDDIGAMDDGQLHDYVRTALTKAIRFGASSERGIIMWICLQIMAGLDFYEKEHMRNLIQTKAPLDEILEHLYSRLCVLEIRERSK
ncbi:MAG: hypothetical protein WCO00_07610 [Rhodospirillaceae bacterium]